MDPILQSFIGKQVVDIVPEEGRTPALVTLVFEDGTRLTFRAGFDHNHQDSEIDWWDDQPVLNGSTAWAGGDK